MLSATAKKNQRKYAYYHPVHGFRKENNRKKSIIKVNTNVKGHFYLFILGSFLALSLVFVIPSVVISGNTKIMENKITEINSEINSEQIKNSLLEREYMRKTSYSSVYQKAIESGMVEAQTRVNIPKYSMTE